MHTSSNASILPFQQLGLSAQLSQHLESLNLNHPTPIQEQAIPDILNGKDVLAGAQTGTGKTAAYALPLIERLTQQTKEPKTKQIQAIILTPTRELAQQVFDNIQAYTKHTSLKIVVAYGGTSYNVQRQNLLEGADILIATPGRLLDHIVTKSINTNQTPYLVLDEADRMLDMGFWPDIKRILGKLPQREQTLFFSATFNKSVKNFAYKLLNDPVEIQVTPENTAVDTVQQMVYPVDKRRKSELLAYLIGSRNWQQVLVFTKTKQGADELAKELKKDGIKGVSIHGDKSQGARNRALEEFKSHKVRALIATDVAARGLDITELEAVVNYQLPYKAEDYIHRIGRTGRAGKSGIAISLMSQEEEYLLTAVENLLDTRLPQEWLAGFEPSPVSDIEPEKKGRRRPKRSSAKKQLRKRLGY